MTTLCSYTSRDALDRPRNRAADVLVFAGAAVLIWAMPLCRVVHCDTDSGRIADPAAQLRSA
ncbi:hypothetical protein [Nocardia sp. NPDC049526]|uniref:hypothetical protein n=1 Tax=Nocardia sp. NPDC049526 TaxID=3364316 RepID=UPI00378BF41F